MKYIIASILLVSVLASCNRSDTYSYTCRCKDKTTGAVDSVFAINVGTSGEASYYCQNAKDTANKYGKNYACDID